MSIQSDYLQCSSILRFPQGSAARIRAAFAALPPKYTIAQEMGLDHAYTVNPGVILSLGRYLPWTTVRVDTKAQKTNLQSPLACGGFVKGNGCRTISQSNGRVESTVSDPSTVCNSLFWQLEVLAACSIRDNSSRS
jgi:hypothetical protein